MIGAPPGLLPKTPRAFRLGRTVRHHDRPWSGRVEWVSAGAYEPAECTLPRVALTRKADGTLYACRVDELETLGIAKVIKIGAAA